MDTYVARMQDCKVLRNGVSRRMNCRVLIFVSFFAKKF